MDQHEESSLSRAVSSLDLNKALAATQEKLRDGSYSTAALLGLRPKVEESEKDNHDAREVNGDGVLTPPDQSYPNPPPPTPETTHSIDNVANELAEDELNENGVQVVAAGSEEKKKKKKKKSSGVNKKPKPTGFEEFYADTPVTPAEFEEESDTYASSVPFHERIQTCIQRYRARRNLDSVRNNILTKYFILGGIEASTTKAFTGGLDKTTIEDSTADEIRAFQATDYVSTGNKKYFDPLDSDGWVVDFEGVAKGFFGYRVPTQFTTDREDDIKLYCSVIRNFLNYVLAHGVCPEYNEDVMAAREICTKAETELVAVKKLGYIFPGEFNIAASTLYGGFYEGRHISTQGWQDDTGADEAIVSMLGGLSVADAEHIFKTSIAQIGNDKVWEKVMAEDVKIIKTETRCFEVVGIVPADQKTREADDVAGGVKVMGIMVVKPWEGPGIYEEDFTDDESDTVENGPEEKFFMEDETLKLVFVGLKMEVVVHELDIGIKFFDSVNGLYCSFHTYLPNEKMMAWKDPVPNTRESPTEDNPDIEEDAMFQEIEDDVKNDEKLALGK